MSVRFFVIMGAAGSGKTTVGKALASRLGWGFCEADDLHSQASIAKMSAGIPLEDEDRKPWLAALHELMVASAEKDRSKVIACSALKEQYRRTLAAGVSGVVFVYLKADRDLILTRLADRRRHYMKPRMADSQLVDLEEPSDAITVDAGLPVDVIVNIIVGGLGEPQQSKGGTRRDAGV